MEEPNKNRDKRDELGRFIEGNLGGPGRPIGSISIKDEVRKHLEANPEDVKEIVSHFIKNNRELMWQMLEGRPSQQLDGNPDKPLTILVSKEVALKNSVPTSESKEKL